MEEKKEESIISEGSTPEDEDCVHDGWVTVTTNNVKVNNNYNTVKLFCHR